jgi:hypothetical protein
VQTMTNNAIAWAAFQLQGGWKNILLTAGGYAMFIVVVLMTAAHFATIPVAALMYNLLLALLPIQGALLLLFAPSRIQGAIRRDVAGGMIESHRLMPVPPTHAVVGYLIGPTAQATSLAAATFLIGCFLANGSFVAQPRWIVANLMLLELAAVMWVVMGAAALHNAQAVFFALFVTTPSIVNSNVAHVVPGAVLLLPPITGKTIFGMQGQIDRVHVMAFALHAVVAAIFLRAAARKYVRSDAAGMTPLMGLGLLACWAVASVVGMSLWDEVRPSGWQWRASNLSGATVVCTLVAGILLALVPVTQAVNSRGAGTARRRRRSYRVVLVPLAVLLAAVALAIVPAAIAPVETGVVGRQRALAHTAIAAASVAVSACLLARAFYVQGMRAWLAIAVWLVLVCAGPLAYDAGHHALLGDGSDFQFGAISDMSPLGALHAVWIRGQQPAWSAAAVQATFAAIAGALLLASCAVRRWRGEGPEEHDVTPDPAR